VSLEYNGVATILADLLGVEEARGKAEMTQCRGAHVQLSWLQDIYEGCSAQEAWDVLPGLTCCIWLDALFL